MKKKFGLFALVLTVLLCGSLFLFAACGDGEEEEPSATPAISVTVNETARQSGATIEGDTEDTYTIAASVVNGEEGASVTISYVYESGEAEDFSGSTFSPREAGTYVFTFTAEGASNFTLTFEIAEAQAPVVPVITASVDKDEITAGGQVTLTWSATENAQVIVTYTKDGTSASALLPVSGEAFTIADAGVYVFTFAAEGAKPVTVTVTVTAKHTHVWATKWTIEPATATEAGKASRACIASGCTDPVEVQEVTLPALKSDEAKDFYTVTDKTPATCKEEGVSTYAWVKNGEIAFDVTGDVSYAQSAHTDLAYVAAVAPTCTEAGKIAHAYCDGCKKYYNVTGDASSYTIGEEITEGAAGLTGDPATGHSATVSVAFADYLTGDSSDYTWTKAVEATCGSCQTKVTLTVDTLEAETFTYSSTDGTLVATIEQGNDTVTVTVTDVPEPVTPVITLSVTLGGKPVEGVVNNGSATVCVGTEIGYAVTVTGDGSVTGVYIYEDGEATDLASAEGTFPFEDIGTYRFTFSADGADPYTYTVEVIAHDYTEQPYISAGEEGHYQVCKNCNVAHSETVAHVLQAENNNTQHWQGCTVCDYETAKSDHVLTWQSDDTQHWQACSGCAYTTAKENHSYAIAYTDGTVDYVCECGKVSASATVTITVAGGTGIVTAEAFSWNGEEFEIDLSQVEISELAADVKVVYYRIADELIVTDESYAFAESVAIEAVLEDTQATIGGTGVHWNETAWSSVLKKGDAMTVAGQLDSTAAFNWQGVFVQVYSTENVVGAFRLDNYINGEEGPEDNAAYSTGENFILTKDGTYTDFNEKGTFINLIKDCTLRITIDWTNPALIEITLNLTGKVDGVNKVQTVCYTIAAKPDTSLKDSYSIGLGYEEATYASLLWSVAMDSMATLNCSARSAMN